jgi:hypothetical protein
MSDFKMVYDMDLLANKWKAYKHQKLAKKSLNFVKKIWELIRFLEIEDDLPVPTTPQPNNWSKRYTVGAFQFFFLFLFWLLFCFQFFFQFIYLLLIKLALSFLYIFLVVSNYIVFFCVRREAQHQSKANF